MTYENLHKTLLNYIQPEKAEQLPRYFKTGPGEYGEGDRFLGITMPDIRIVARRFGDLSGTELETLMRSPYHEERMCALVILVNRYKRNQPNCKAQVVAFYLAHLRYINNWDLVDVSCPHILGHHFFEHPQVKQLEAWAASSNLWERRIAMMATSYGIQNNEFDTALHIANLLVDDPHDLIHKAVGWMLREIGKRNLAVERVFLDRYAATMPRTMLRYALERLPVSLKTHYMQLKARLPKHAGQTLSGGRLGSGSGLARKVLTGQENTV